MDSGGGQIQAAAAATDTDRCGHRDPSASGDPSASADHPPGHVQGTVRTGIRMFEDGDPCLLGC